MSNYDGMTGHLFEEEVLGRCTVEYREKMPYEPRAKAIATARKSQPQKQAGVAKILEGEIKRQLGADAELYTAVRTPLDFYHGVDAFVEFKGVVVTLDVTTNPHKDACKADLLVGQDELTSMKAVMQLAGRITREVQAEQRRYAR